MKSKILSVAMLLIVFVACKKAETTESVITEPTKPETEITQKDCYEIVKGKDTVKLSLVQNGNNVTGELAYNWFEKDRNSGTLSGIFVGDTLFADYTFQSEGTTSVRETAFVKNGDKLIEGFGEVTEKDGKQVFKNPKALKFDNSIVLERTECE